MSNFGKDSGHGKDQAETLRRLSSDAVVPLDCARRRVVAVTGGKGGVGKSTVAVNLAISYARRGAKILMLDGDMGMADLNLLLGLAPNKSIADVLAGTPVGEVLVATHGIHLLPALNGSYALANLDERGRGLLFGALDELSDQFDTLVVDTAAGIGSNVVGLAGAAADVVVVATPEPLSLADAYACLKVLSLRAGVKRAFLLPNAVRSPSEADEVVARLTALVDRFLDLTLTPLPAIPHDRTISVAAAAGVPIVLHSPEAPAARALKKAAQRIDALSQPGTRPGVLARWLRGIAQPALIEEGEKR